MAIATATLGLVGRGLTVFVTLLGLSVQGEPQHQPTLQPVIVPTTVSSPTDDIPPALAASLRAETEKPKSHWVWALVTAYDAPCEICCPGGDGHTSTGLDVHRHPYGIAADPRLLPYGTKVRVPGYLEKSYPGAFWTVDDTGGAMRQDAKKGIVHLDVRVKSHREAQRWGTRWVLVEVINVGS